MQESQVLITSDKAKLPALIITWLDPAAPLGADVIFFEKRFESSEIMQSLMIAVGLAVAAMIMIPLGIATLFSHSQATVNSNVDYWPVGFGLVLALGTWMMFGSVSNAWRLRGLQKLGICTRHGTYITFEFVAQVDQNSTTVIPCDCFARLDSSSIWYVQNKVEKEMRFPKALVQASTQQLHDSVAAWAKSVAVNPPPMT